MQEHPGEKLGRWPSNLLLVHGPGCRRVGTQRVPAHAAFGRPRDSKGGILNKTGAARKNPHPGFGDEAGLETVAAWECQEDCPVRMMDEQSGDRVSGHLRAEVQRGAFGQNGVYSKASGTGLGRTYEANAGGASRFYPQFSDLASALDWLVKLVNGPS